MPAGILDDDRGSPQFPDRRGRFCRVVKDMIMICNHHIDYNKNIIADNNFLTSNNLAALL